MNDTFGQTKGPKSALLKKEDPQNESLRSKQEKLDKEIIALYFARNEQAIRMTENTYGQLCSAVVGNILRDRSDAEECVNDTYLTLWNRIPPEHPQNLAGFIVRIARHLALDKLKYNQAEKRVPSALLLSLSELEETLADSSVLQSEEAELGHLISEFLKQEKESARLVFIRRYYFYDSIDQIARRYSFSRSKVKSMLFHTRNKLKTFLTERGVCI